MDKTEIAAERQKYMEHLPVGNRKRYARAMTGKSRVAAMKEKCYDCTNWQAVEIRECPIVTCTLWSYRPCQDKKEKKLAQLQLAIERANNG
jgi:hypothetical protein